MLYLWPRAGGTSLDFYLRTRLPMTAKSEASRLYDYYNPEALAEVTPFVFKSTARRSINRFEVVGLTSWTNSLR